MPVYAYEALTPAGRLMTGTVEAAGLDEARAMLQDMRLSVQQLTAAPRARPRSVLGRQEFLLFNQQLSAIAKAGIPLERGLRELAGDAPSPRLRQLIEAVADELEAGASLREAFRKHAGHFPPMYEQLLDAGVRSGRLGEMLASLIRHNETADLTRRIVFEAAAYPAVVLSLAMLVFTLLLVFVVPKFGRIYEETGRALPPATIRLLMLSNHVEEMWCGIGALVATAVVGYGAMGHFAGGRRVRETVTFHLPALGRVCRQTLLSRLTDAMALLAGAGCDLPSILRLAGATTGSELARADCEDLARWVEQGERLTGAAGRCRVLPGLLLYSIEFGAHRNDLVDSLYGLSAMYHDQARAGQGRLQGLLMPVMIVFVGMLIGGAVAALFLPMISIMKAMQAG